MSSAQEVQLPNEYLIASINQILSSLPVEESERLAPHLEQIHTSHGQTLHRTDEIIEHVYFPLGGMISLVAQLSDGASVEVGFTGFEGMAGISVVLGVDKSTHHAIVQIPGAMMRLKTEVLKSELKRGGALQSLLLRYAQSLLLQISHVAACNRYHIVEARLARWLLMSADRCGCENLPLTHEFISQMLGVRRAGVTIAACALQSARLIDYKRASINITDRQGLERLACECYPVLKNELDNLSSGT